MSGRRIPAGWYDDPAGSGGLRWFDGAAWTTQVQPPGTSIPVDEPAVAVGPPVSTSVGPVATVAREEQETATSASASDGSVRTGLGARVAALPTGAFVVLAVVLGLVVALAAVPVGRATVQAAAGVRPAPGPRAEFVGPDSLAGLPRGDAPALLASLKPVLDQIDPKARSLGGNSQTQSYADGPDKLLVVTWRTDTTPTSSAAAGHDLLLALAPLEGGATAGYATDDGANIVCTLRQQPRPFAVCTWVKSGSGSLTVVETGVTGPKDLWGASELTKDVVSRVGGTARR